MAFPVSYPRCCVSLQNVLGSGSPRDPECWGQLFLQLRMTGQRRGLEALPSTGSQRREEGRCSVVTIPSEQWPGLELLTGPRPAALAILLLMDAVCGSACLFSNTSRS